MNRLFSAETDVNKINQAKRNICVYKHAYIYIYLGNINQPSTVLEKNGWFQGQHHYHHHLVLSEPTTSLSQQLVPPCMEADLIPRSLSCWVISSTMFWSSPQMEIFAGWMNSKDFFSVAVENMTFGKKRSFRLTLFCWRDFFGVECWAFLLGEDWLGLEVDFGKQRGRGAWSRLQEWNTETGVWDIGTSISINLVDWIFIYTITPLMLGKQAIKTSFCQSVIHVCPQLPYYPAILRIWLGSKQLPMQHAWKLEKNKCSFGKRVYVIRQTPKTMKHMVEKSWLD